MNIGTSAGIGINPYVNTTHTSKQQKSDTGFTGSVMKCVQAGRQKVMLCQDALMSYASPQTGESVNIYKSPDYSTENPVYLLKGLDRNGKEFVQEVNAHNIDPAYCSYNELMVLNLETGHTSPGDYLRAVAVRDQADIQSYFASKDFLSYINAVMSDHKRMGSWDSYLAYDQWLQSLRSYTTR